MLSDVHIGADSFNKELFEAHLEWADRENAYFLLVGDLFEVALPSRIEEAMWEISMGTDDQYQTGLKYLWPRRNRIIFSLTGNHDARVWKKTGFDVAKAFAKDLGCFYNNHGGYIMVTVGEQTYKFALFHGASSAQNPWLEIQRRYEVYDDADILGMGNNHQLMAKMFIKKRVVDGVEERFIVHMIRTGSFLNEPDYSRSALYSPTLEGAPMVTLGSKTRKIMVDVAGETRFG